MYKKTEKIYRSQRREAAQSMKFFSNIAGVPKLAIHCLISCNVKSVKAISLK